MKVTSFLLVPAALVCPRILRGGLAVLLILCSLHSAMAQHSEKQTNPARDDSEASAPPGHDVVGQQARIRAAAEGLFRSGRFHKLMQEAEIPAQEGVELSSGDLFKRILLLQGCLLKAAGFSDQEKSPALRETAVALSVEYTMRVQRQESEDSQRSITLKLKPQYDTIIREEVKGFDDLSNESVFLDKADFQKRAGKILLEHYADETPGVKERLLTDIGEQLTESATRAKEALRLFVRYIFYGSKGFGTREAFLRYEGLAARRQAMEDKIYQMIKKHPKYCRAAIDSDYVKELVSKQAADLAEAIKDVPPVR